MKWACEEETHGPSIGIFSFTYLDEKCQGAPLKNRHDSFPSPSQHDRVELFYNIGVFPVALRPSLSQIFLPAILQENCFREKTTGPLKAMTRLAYASTTSPKQDLPPNTNHLLHCKQRGLRN